jgi:hypothetical protein
MDGEGYRQSSSALSSSALSKILDDALAVGKAGANRRKYIEDICAEAVRNSVNAQLGEEDGKKPIRGRSLYRYLLTEMGKAASEHSICENIEPDDFELVILDKALTVVDNLRSALVRDWKDRTMVKNWRPDLGTVVTFVIAFFVVAFTLCAMVVFPVFRYVVIGLITLIALGLYGWVQQNKEQTTTASRQSPLGAFSDDQLNALYENQRIGTEATEISPEDITFERVALTKEYDWWVLSGEILNKSKEKALNSISFMVRMKDCSYPAAKSGVKLTCVVIGEETTNVDVKIPPGQKRSFSSYAIKFPNLPLALLPEWEYRMLSAQAALPKPPSSVVVR